ncbi:bifunctional DNA primase/polymerase [Nocardia sp. NPDC060249]|uniref:bifunctional DNA primase/polymerase n=1 Tax=Nocardia sp. NPDC060249 TaxID=3347082 RepID=UPI0036655EF6
MPIDHARKNELAALKTRLEIKHHDAIALLDHPDPDERETLCYYLETFEWITTYDEALAEMNNPLNHTFCEECGWTNGMVCPECPGCGCYNGRCTGWRHHEFAADDDEPDEDDGWYCEGCGANDTAYDVCTCPPEPPSPAEALRRGLSVFALAPGTKQPAPGADPHTACGDLAEVQAVWRAGDNVGVSCAASGIVVLDLDVPDTEDGAYGVETWHKLWKARGEKRPHTLTVWTPSGGSHVYFRAPADRVIASSSGGRSGLGPGIDVRAPGIPGRGGGYVVGPDSLIDERRYSIARDHDIADLPAWIADILEVS